MEKKTSSSFVSKSLPPVKLYLGDLSAIEEIFQEVGDRVKYETKSFKFENLEEVSKLAPDELSQLSITSYSPHLSLNLKGSEVRLYCGDNTASARGAFEKLSELLKSRMRPIIGRLTFNRIMSFFFAIWMVPPFIIKGATGALWFQVGILAPLLCLVLSFRFFEMPLNIILPIQRHAEKSFWQRKGDDILVNLIVSVVTAAVTLLLAK